MKNLFGWLIASSSLLLSLILVEALLAVVAPYPDPLQRQKLREHAISKYVPSAFPPHLRLTISSNEGLPGVSSTTVFSTNNLGFRGDTLHRPKPPGEFRIFLVGGSTTECLYLDDTEALNSMLQRRLEGRFPVERRVRVYNAGKSGDRSYDHVAMVAHRIVHLEPDAIVVFAGVNDLTSAMSGRDYLLLPETRDTHWRLLSLLHLASTEFQIPRRLHAALKRRSAADLLGQLRLSSNYYEKTSLARAAPVATTPPRTNLQAYDRNLRTLIGIAAAQGVPLFFMTQATTWDSQSEPEVRKYHWMTYRDGVVYPDSLMHRAMERYNDVLRQVAAEYRVPVLDLAHALPKSLRYFFDDVHFNVLGADTTATLLADFLLDHGLPGAAPPLPEGDAATSSDGS